MRVTLAVIAAIAAVVVLADAAYTIRETGQAIITQLGEPIGDAITEPGLHFKLPFVQKVTRFDKRWLEWDAQPSEMPTKEKTYIWVDAYARWRIKDVLQFFRSVHDERGAQSRLDDIITSETRNVIAAYDLKEVVRLSNRELPKTVYDIELIAGDPEDDPEARVGESTDERIKMGRDKLTQLILEKAQKAMPDFGIELVDLQFQRVNYTESVEEKVFQRMISERKRIAELYRSQGKGESARINGETQRELKKIESEAYKTVQEIKGEADAQATEIYAAAHNKDPDFYRLVKTLDSYQKSIDPETTIILSTSSDFFELLTSMGR